MAVPAFLRACFVFGLVALAAAAPTLDAINDITAFIEDGAVAIALTGVSAATRISAESSNLAVAPNPRVAYTPPAATATLTVTPKGVEGRSDITVVAIDADFNVATQDFRVTFSHRPVDCQYSPYSVWTECSKRCGSGTRTRTREITTPAAHGGVACDIPSLSVTEACNTIACNPPTLSAITDRTIYATDPGPHDVFLSGISTGAGESWQSLTVSATSSNVALIPHPEVTYNFPETSGGLTYNLNRGVGGGAVTITVTATDSGGDSVVRSFIVTIVADCGVQWGAWSTCSASCGGGTQSRQQIIAYQPANGGKACPDESTLSHEEQPCNENPCPIDCVMEWGEWGQCSAACDGGVRTRTHYTVVPAQYGGVECPYRTKDFEEPCNTVSCAECEYDWGAWSECSATCGGGFQTRDEYISRHASADGGFCRRPTSERRACNTETCPVNLDCVWEWKEWTECSASCDGGAQFRGIRILELPKRGGEPCPAQVNEKRACNTESCSDVVQALDRNSCQTRCGDVAPGGCGCDQLCAEYGDCCADYEAQCVQPQSNLRQGVGSCVGRCGAAPTGNSFSGCFCDSTCYRHGDCCPDFAALCPQQSAAGASAIQPISNSCQNRCHSNERPRVAGDLINTYLTMQQNPYAQTYYPQGYTAPKTPLAPTNPYSPTLPTGYNTQGVYAGYPGGGFTGGSTFGVVNMFRSAEGEEGEEGEEGKKAQPVFGFSGLDGEFKGAKPVPTAPPPGSSGDGYDRTNPASPDYDRSFNNYNGQAITFDPLLGFVPVNAAGQAENTISVSGGAGTNSEFTNAGAAPTSAPAAGSGTDDRQPGLPQDLLPVDSIILEALLNGGQRLEDVLAVVMRGVPMDQVPGKSKIVDAILAGYSPEVAIQAVLQGVDPATLVQRQQQLGSVAQSTISGNGGAAQSAFNPVVQQFYMAPNVAAAAMAAQNNAVLQTQLIAQNNVLNAFNFANYLSAVNMANAYNTAGFPIYTQTTIVGGPNPGAVNVDGGDDKQTGTTGGSTTTTTTIQTGFYPMAYPVVFPQAPVWYGYPGYGSYSGGYNMGFGGAQAPVPSTYPGYYPPPPAPQAPQPGTYPQYPQGYPNPYPAQVPQPGYPYPYPYPQQPQQPQFPQLPPTTLYNLPCYCDLDCVTNKDCCPDFNAKCTVQYVEVAVQVNVPVPYPVDRPYPVEVPVEVQVPVPYPVAVPVMVERVVEVGVPVPYPVDRPVPVPVNNPVAVGVPYPVPIPVDNPVAVPFPVEVQVPVPYPVAVDRPYPVQVLVDNPVAVPVPVGVPQPYPVAVPVNRPIAVDNPVPFPVRVDVPVAVGVPVAVPQPYPVAVAPQPMPVPIQVAITASCVGRCGQFNRGATALGGGFRSAGGFTNDAGLSAAFRRDDGTTNAALAEAIAGMQAAVDEDAANAAAATDDRQYVAPTCNCDVNCRVYGDCCQDFAVACPQYVPAGRRLLSKLANP